eukprot:TRINITY_DN15273_c0_g1_i2.p2 TRINITY_DN15273_c0_g1~~TRINITY_DN15273_c0_g1_i2.p2  ORF type:complete len:363 (+),score=49.70 TRINITY_DN15273_c0_g1_i2:80-1168(+)
MTTKTPKSSGRLKRKLEDSTNKQNSQTKDESDLKNSSKKQGNKKVKVEVNSGGEVKESPAVRRSQRACVLSNSGYKEGGSSKEFKENDHIVEIKEEQTAQTEAEALEVTKSDVFRRRLFNLSVEDHQGNSQPVQRFDLRKDKEEQWFIKGSIACGDTKGDNKNQTCMVKEKFGPIESWKVDYTKSTPEIVLQTRLAEYSCQKAESQYRKDFSFLKEQVDLAAAVYRMLDSRSGGSLDVTLEQAVAKIARTKVIFFRIFQGRGNNPDSVCWNFHQFEFSEGFCRSPGIRINENRPQMLSQKRTIRLRENELGRYFQQGGRISEDEYKTKGDCTKLQIRSCHISKRCSKDFVYLNYSEGLFFLF